MGLRLTLYSAGAATMLDIAKSLGTNFFVSAGKSSAQKLVERPARRLRWMAV